MRGEKVERTEVECQEARHDIGERRAPQLASSTRTFPLTTVPIGCKRKLYPTAFSHQPFEHGEGTTAIE